MISLDQIQMLERKVESAVTKMTSLQEMNASLREKNTELEHANSLLTQRVSSFEVDQSRIEQGILNALDRLNSMESAVLQTGSVHSTPKLQPSSTEDTGNQAKPSQPTTENLKAINTIQNKETSEEIQDPLLTELDNNNEEVTLDFDSDEFKPNQNPQFDIF